MAPASPVPSSSSSKVYEGAPLDRRVFNSWDEFETYMNSYARRSYQIFRKRTSTSVKLRNRRVAKRLLSRSKKTSQVLEEEHTRVENPQLIPERYNNYSLTLVCTHSGAFVSRGTGRRSRQDVRATRCNVQINACLKLTDPVANRYQVHVTRALLTHNHRVDKETFLQYSNTRLKLSSELLSCVELMRKTGVKPKDVHSYIMKHSSCTPTLKDVQNILHRLRNQEETASAADAPATTNARLEQTHVIDESTGNAVLKLTTEDQVLRDFRLAHSVPLDGELLDLVDSTTQFKVSRAVGNAVATLLAEMSATEFAAAFRVMDVAMNIVRERQDEKQAENGAVVSKEGEGGAMMCVDSCGSGASVDDSWTRGI
ncbi:hypothetical protein KXD40_003450 [Peronospora effusa]|uniref:FAR1 domain-containing protein n=1 Tax=Peronospora effusa TaxID=542832 RepID=A0A3M6VTM9_9STRA|nr:hypothetical protein DD238_006503 [Peronospora effusa]RQM13440.1 hypothetical protein DD237_006779 [Peronospora effusa]UIZ23046.1 hypothetical protein KXD40_003450 [Peronospora effusa]CAI5724815.1 unnamed protein product [Peronospora effusa]